jgi:AraC family transcriptional regulator
MKSITYKELPRYAPGRLLGNGDGRGWEGLNYRSYRHLGMEIELPPMDDYMIIAFENGRTPLRRCVDGKWSDYILGPGDLTLLTRAQKSDWSWTETVDVSHVYLKADLVENVAHEVFEREIADIRLKDILRASDPGISRCMAVIREEASDQSLGGSLIAEAAARELSVRLLRAYAETDFVKNERFGQMSPVISKRIVDFVNDRIQDKISYEDAAALAGLGSWSFMRKFKQTFGVSFHNFVLTQRVERAVYLLNTSNRPLKNIAVDCGFYDQPHMNRVFKKIKGVTPAAFRRV